jgi:hypothetical protein
VLVVALATTSWQLLRGSDAETRAELARVAADLRVTAGRVEVVEREQARTGARFDALDKTLTRMDGRLDKIDVHLEQLTAPSPRSSH